MQQCHPDTGQLNTAYQPHISRGATKITHVYLKYNPRFQPGTRVPCIRLLFTRVAYRARPLHTRTPQGKTLHHTHTPAVPTNNPRIDTLRARFNSVPEIDTAGAPSHPLVREPQLATESHEVGILAPERPSGLHIKQARLPRTARSSLPPPQAWPASIVTTPTKSAHTAEGHNVYPSPRPAGCTACGKPILNSDPVCETPAFHTSASRTYVTVRCIVGAEFNTRLTAHQGVLAPLI